MICRDCGATAQGLRCRRCHRIHHDREQARTFWMRAVRCKSGCWEWTGRLMTNGYGRLYVRNQVIGAHRRAYELARGPIPAGMFVLHRCDNPPCVNPAHLFLGTNADNMADMARKGRAGARHGEANARHRLTEATVLQVRELYASGGWSHRTLGERFGIPYQYVGRILTRQAWAHL